MPENKLTKRIQHILTPLQGETMAKDTIKIECAGLGLTPENLSPADLPALVKNIQEDLTIFLGTERASELARIIERSAV